MASKMTLNASSLLLWTPWTNSSEYHVSDEVYNTLTEEEFFKNCFVEPDFDKQIENLQTSTPVEFDDSDWRNFPVTEAIDEEIRILHAHKRAASEFINWLYQDTSAIYCISADAGNGKTTYLRYLKYKYRNEPFEWEIIDLTRAYSPVIALSREVYIPNFRTLNSKVISLLLSKIFEPIGFNLPKDTPIFDRARKLTRFFEKYKRYAQIDFQLNYVRIFFDDSVCFNKNAKEISKEDLDCYALSIVQYIEKTFQENGSARLLEELIRVYSVVLECTNPTRKNILAFDNIERFINHQEICNLEIEDFRSMLKRINHARDINDSNYTKKFKMLILMRNTTCKMSRLSFQRLDFGPHELNINNWFPIDLMISKKCEWYYKHDISTPELRLFDTLLGIESFDGRGPRSIQQKITLLFNDDKRGIIRLLEKAICYIEPGRVPDETTLMALRTFNMYSSEGGPWSPQLARFAARSIIIRLLYDALKRDGFFQNIVTPERKLSEVTEDEDYSEETDRLGLARKILTILNNYSLTVEYADQQYMPFDDIIPALFGHGKHYVNEFQNNTGLRQTVTKILFYMNYYNTQQDNWLHFIDIQCNLGDENGSLRIGSEDKLLDLLISSHKFVGIRIMPAGKAYLRYVVHSFEYFSCRIDSAHTPPLLCTIPSKEILRSCRSVENLLCVRIVEKVKKDAFKCYEAMKKRMELGATDYMYKSDMFSEPIFHALRILYSHEGYINNFIECITQTYSDKENLDYAIRKNLSKLISALNGIRSEYRSLSAQKWWYEKGGRIFYDQNAYNE